MNLLGRVVFALAGIAVTLPMAGQSLPRTEAGLSLKRLTDSAGIIFVGTMLKVERVVADDSKPATVMVSFRVDNAVRGCAAGQRVAVVEWAELWDNGGRYRNGQQVLLFLYPPSEAGLTSTVAGDLGKVQIGPQGLLLTPQQARFLSSQDEMSGAQPDALELGNKRPNSRHLRLRDLLPLRDVQ
jgi:hypothetical protein